MEIGIAAFIGCWLTFFAVWAYIKVKKDYSTGDIQENTNEKEDQSR